MWEHVRLCFGGACASDKALQILKADSTASLSQVLIGDADLHRAALLAKAIADACDAAVLSMASPLHLDRERCYS